MKTALALMLACLALPACSEKLVFSKKDDMTISNKTLTIYHDTGGNIDAYELFMKTNRLKIHIVGTCNSSCTMFLGDPKTCIEPGAIFGFHGPSSDNNSPAHIYALVLQIASHYPSAELQRLFIDDMSLSKKLTKLTAAQVISLAPKIKLCEKETTE